MAVLKFLCVHCTSTPIGRKVTKSDIERWHKAPRENKDGSFTYLGKNYKTIEDLPDDKIYGISIKGFRGRGWDRVGYSDMIHINGYIENLTPYDEDDIITNDEKTWGVSGHNSDSRHVVYVGGADNNIKPLDTLTAAQFISMEKYIKEFLCKHPDCLIVAHYQLDNRKACPSFDAKDKFYLMGIPFKSLYK